MPNLTSLKCIVFDLDDTLVSRNGYLFFGVEHMLNTLVNKGIKLVIASYNTQAAQVLERYNIHHYFDAVYYENWKFKHDYKHSMLSNIINTLDQNFKINLSEILFIDDSQDNINTADSLGLKTGLITDGNTVTMTKILVLHNNKQ